ncbi:BTAD domain-containing putative transcriptional regulator [Streptomyces sp. NPDC059853]|uniref:BTAD domain-containing putative transcriptional regulator n=1 Tax=Streptomyces sp. NPDC059853 TaxID=3346973 RepID=UPI003651523D
MSAAAGPGVLRFRLLGPLEVLRDGTPVRLRGLHQRAALAYLLLRPNRATATSELIAALWPGQPPASARKMVQNAVWQLRTRLLPPPPDDGGGEQRERGAVLWSRPPGYLLQVHPGALDLHRFHTLAAEGRARMREGAVATASLRWREALDLWRGPMLADLVEAGMRWPELEAAETARLDVLEKFFDAELALGRHDSVLPELRAVTRAEPRREPFTGQLMLALHRGGRHSEALDVYTAIRTELAEELGLEPGRRLHALHQAILTGDPSLDLTPPPGALRVAAAPPAPAGPLPAAPDGAPEAVRVHREISVLLLAVAFPGTPDGTGVPDDPHGLGDPHGIGCPDSGSDADALERAEAETAALETVIGEAASRFGGSVLSRIGSCRLIVFGATRAHGDEPLRAVSTALAVRQRLRHRPPERRLRLRAVVDTGDALVRHGPPEAGPPAVTSAVLDRAQALLPLVPPGEVWVGPATRAQTGTAVDYQRARVSSAAWAVRALRPAAPAGEKTPLLERAQPLRTLTALLDGAPPGPRAALVVGAPGLGKSALLDAFARLVTERAPGGRPLLARVAPATVDDSQLFAVAAQLCAACGIGPADPPGGARHKLWALVERVAADPEEATGLFTRLLTAIGHLPGHERTAAADEVAAAWLILLERLAAERPVLVLVDDLHGADDTVLRLVDRAAARPDGPLVVATARPGVFHRRPAWAAGREPSAGLPLTLTLEPLSDASVAERVRDLLPPDEGTGRELTEAVTALAGGNPLFAAAFVHHALRRPAPDPAVPRTALIPGPVRRALGAELDALPAGPARAVRDAAVIGEDIGAAAFAVLTRQPAHEAARTLADLARRGVLAPTGTAPDGTPRYRFRRPLLREVAYTQLPPGARAARHAALAGGPGEAPPPVPRALLRLHSVRERRLR